jgi:hypothetical protein
VDEGVDKVCRHAGHVVRRLGTELWKRSIGRQVSLPEQEKRDPPAVWKKNFTGISRSVIHSLYPQAMGGDLWITGLAGSMLAGTIDLIIFDGVFDRRVRSQARG